MRPRSPSEYYIKFLILHPDQYSTEDIKERLLDEALEFISVGYIDRLRTKLKPPKPFYPDDPRHKPSLAFILRERVNSMFQRDLSMKMALGILNTPRAKEFVEVMSCTHAPLPAIASAVSRQHKAYCTPDALELYLHYFWNTDLLNSDQMRLLVELRIDTLVENVPEFSGRRAALKHAYYKGALKVATDLPYSPTTAMLAQMRLGIRPSRYELALRLIEAKDTAMLRAIEAAQQDGPGDSQKFLNYANGGRILEELLQMVAKPEDDMREQLASIALRTETRALPSVHQLSEGRHTVDIAPTKDPDHDDAESGDAESRTGDVHGRK